LVELVELPRSSCARSIAASCGRSSWSSCAGPSERRELRRPWVDRPRTTIAGDGAGRLT
jgi:hypothetical protein